MDLVCPICKGTLAVSASEATCEVCGRAYLGTDGVLLLIEGLSQQHASQRRFFDAAFSEYSEYAIENWRASFLERIFAALDLPHRHGRYLDVGVGGSGATVIESARRGTESYGCDLSVGGILRARRFASLQGVEEKAIFVVSAAEALPFSDASFGALSAVALLEHLDDDDVAVAEFARVTEPGGRVWVMVPHAYRYMPFPLWPIYKWHDRKLGHKRHYTARQLSELFESHGFRHISTEYSAHPVKVLQFALSKLFPALRSPRSAWWWRLERLDRRARSRPLGALHVAALFVRSS